MEVAGGPGQPIASNSSPMGVVTAARASATAQGVRWAGSHLVEFSGQEGSACRHLGRSGRQECSGRQRPLLLGYEGLQKTDTV